MLGMIRYTQEHGTGSYWDLAFLDTDAEHRAELKRVYSALGKGAVDPDGVDRRIRRLERDVALEQRRIVQIRTSETWRVGQAVTAVPRLIANIFKR